MKWKDILGSTRLLAILAMLFVLSALYAARTQPVPASENGGSWSRIGIRIPPPE